MSASEIRYVVRFDFGIPEIQEVQVVRETAKTIVFERGKGSLRRWRAVRVPVEQRKRSHLSHLDRGRRVSARTEVRDRIVKLAAMAKDMQAKLYLLEDLIDGEYDVSQEDLK